jgi:hypothetical protein
MTRESPAVCAENKIRARTNPGRRRRTCSTDRPLLGSVRGIYQTPKDRGVVFLAFAGRSHWSLLCTLVYLIPKHRSKSTMRAASLFKKADLSEIGLNMQDCTSPRCEEVQWRAKQVWVRKHVRSNGCITRLSLCTHACALHVTGIPSAIWRRSRYTREEGVGMDDPLINLRCPQGLRLVIKAVPLCICVQALFWDNPYLIATNA